MGFVWSGLPRCAGGVGFGVHYIAFCAILVTLPDLDRALLVFGNPHYALSVINTTLRIFGNQQNATLRILGNQRHTTQHYASLVINRTQHYAFWVINTTLRISGNQNTAPHSALLVITTLRIFGNQHNTTLRIFGDHSTTRFW